MYQAVVLDFLTVRDITLHTFLSGEQKHSALIVFQQTVDYARSDNHAPNFKEVDGAYWFRVVRASIRNLHLFETCMPYLMNCAR